MKPLQKAILIVSILSLTVPALAAASTSNLVFVGQQNLRVTIDGKHYGSFTTKRVVAEGISPGTHKLVIKSFNPKFLKRYAELGSAVREAVGRYAGEVRSGGYPQAEHGYETDGQGS